MIDVTIGFLIGVQFVRDTGLSFFKLFKNQKPEKKVPEMSQFALAKIYHKKSISKEEWLEREKGKRTDLETSDTDYLKLMDDAGITPGTAQTWQKVARVPEGE